MAAVVLCAICHKRKAKRRCPGVRGDICAICCGTEREVTVECPFDCTYLRASRRYDAEKTTLMAGEIPFNDIEVSDAFIYEHEQIVGQIGYRALRFAMDNPGVVDNDVLDALDKLVRTYQTQQSGIYYESLPEKPSALGLFREVRRFLDEAQEKQRRTGGLSPLKDSDIIRSFVFLYRLGRVHSNGRVRGRAFLDFLRQNFPEAASVKEEPRLIVPGR